MKRILLTIVVVMCVALGGCEKDSDNLYYQVANSNAILYTMSGYGNVNIKNYSNAQIAFDDMARWFREAFNQCLRNSFEISCGTLSATYYNLDYYDIHDSADIVVTFFTRDGMRCEAHIYRQSGKYTLINHTFRTGN